MIKAFSHEQGQDIFILNSYGYLIHRWTRKSRKHLQDYKIIAEDVSCNPGIIYVQPFYHIFYIDKTMRLRHQQINFINTFQSSQIQIASGVEGKANLLNIVRNDGSIYVEVYRKGKLTCYVNRNTSKSGQTNEAQKQGKISQINHNVEVWLQIQECTLLQNIRRLHEISHQAQDARQLSPILEVKFQNHLQDLVYVLKSIYIFKINNSEMFVQNLEGNAFPFYQKKFANKIIDVIEKGIQNGISILYSKSEKEMTIVYQKYPNQWQQLAVQLQTPFKSSATILNVNQTYFLLYLDQNEQLIRCPFLISQQDKVQIDKSQSMPYLKWQEIQDRCTPLGEQGYHADCFHFKQQNLVIKKFRKPSKAFKSNREVYYLKKIQRIQPNLFHHDIISKGIITGFSMTFYPGQNWYQLTSNPHHILNTNPIARVQLVIKLCEYMKILQQISFCHGDLHLENVLIHIQQQDLVYPKMTVKVIDFGNGFEMFQGETVSEGLTGFSSIVPPEAQFSHKKNYNPWGLNAYQCGRNSLHILLKNAQRNLSKLDYTPLRQLQTLKQNKQYPHELYLLIKQLVHYQIDKRNNALQQDISHLESQTRKIYLQNQKGP